MEASRVMEIVTNLLEKFIRRCVLLKALQRGQMTNATLNGCQNECNDFGRYGVEILVVDNTFVISVCEPLHDVDAFLQ